jgi:hypothetical protein
VAVGDVVEPLGNVITVLLGDAIALRGYLAPGGVVAVGDGLLLNIYVEYRSTLV